MREQHEKALQTLATEKSAVEARLAELISEKEGGHALAALRAEHEEEVAALREAGRTGIRVSLEEQEAAVSARVATAEKKTEDSEAKHRETIHSAAEQDRKAKSDLTAAVTVSFFFFFITHEPSVEGYTSL